ncbi:Spc98 family-domain-containing protein [Halteromyces radiatus]|uniref:Spc98 family-domain-containing protein n=1 Tax=Halteromyces radiatus TaxID=101107 RepID=UPI002220B8A6|nr:Spc98 family-domain-containing protein [Halteromyces radiatus]KAI8089018.1 Spc98 family-domain-containing protein [Halteromyces radiatus]
MATIQTKKNQQQQKLVMPNSMKQYHLQLLQSLQSSSSSSFQQIDGSTIWTQQSQLLTQVVNRIRRSTTTWLFSQVFQQEHNLVKYFTSFRQLFLLGDGDLAVKWLEGLQYISLSSSSSPGKRRRRRQEEEGESLSQTDMKDHHHMDIWQQQKREWRALLVKASIGTDSEDQLDGYTFDTFDTKDTFESLLAIDEDEDHHHYGGRLVYTLQWPIDLFLGEQDMARYSSLWSFLMGLKKVQMALSHVFTTTTADQGQVEVEGQEDDEDDDDPGERLIWRLRSMMLFWIDTLWSHVQGNVITRHYDQLMMACQPTTSSTVPLDFDKVQEAHEHYLMELTRGCLLSTTECRKALIILLQTCMNFCNMVRNEAPLKKKKKKINKKPMSAAEIVSTWTRQLDTTGSTARMEQLSILEETFTQNSDHLFDLLSNQQQDMKISGHLTELLMRLDYNKWYSGQRYKHIPDPLDY